MKITYWDCPYNDYCGSDFDCIYGCLHPNGSGICTKLELDEGFDCELLNDTPIDCVVYNEKWL